MQKKALILSISDYQDENLEDLEFCKNDGQEMFNTLKSIGYEIIDENFLVGKIDYEKAKKTIIKFFQDENVNPKDTLLIYFSGHGVLDGYGGRFFATSQTSTRFPEEYGISFDFLTEQMKKSNSEKKVAILDCCFSGDALSSITGKSVSGGAKGEKQAEKLGREALSRHFEGSQGNCVLASSLSNRLSFQLPDKPFSAFTYYAIEVLKENKDSIDNDGCVTPETLSQFIFSKLRQIKGLNQKPVRNISVAGKIVLAEYPELRNQMQPRDLVINAVEINKQKIKQRNKLAGIIVVSVMATLGISFAVFSPFADHSPQTYSFVTQWGDEDPENYKLSDNVVIDSLGNTYKIVHRNFIHQISNEGEILNIWGGSSQHKGGNSGLTSIAIDSSDNMYVVDQNNHRIQKFDSDGNFITKWGEEGTIEGQFLVPYGIAVDSKNNVYVTDVDRNIIQKFEPR